ncbi:glutathione S-transferase [Kiloniella laminariae]|uniref:Glutathione S-transferase n=1 Tax=Kiloniella laminariae TaxID=454162 RepID=A0ABT4LDG9_9PROT|nr:glutathione S-transferase [Kiloniella laminariae]MCZ4279149.1 glutathione S-transferase [Kiloniella laminariae]
MKTKLPILYSFRRCPYAMRARLALQSSNQQCELREIILRDKPESMLDASPKGTVPVLLLPDGTVLEESLDIMLWALNRHDPQGWLSPDAGSLDEMLTLIKHCETDFKPHLDRYKYPNRYEDVDALEQRDIAENFLIKLEALLNRSGYLFGPSPSLADMALAPFIRQFSKVDPDWFARLNYPSVQKWLTEFLDSPIFRAILKKYPRWESGDRETLFPENEPH